MKAILVRWVFYFLRLRLWAAPGLNGFMRNVLGIFAQKFPKNAIASLPIRGQFSWAIEDCELKLKSNGFDGTVKNLYWFGVNDYESGSLIVWKKLLTNSRTIVDVGAHSGIYSIVAGIQDPNRRVIALEAIHKNVLAGMANIELNDLKNVELIEAAAGKVDGTIDFYEEQNDLPASSSALQGFRENCKTVTVKCQRLDSLAESMNILDIDLMKIDTEATEPDVLTGAHKILTTQRPIVLCEVLKGRTEPALQDIFIKHDYAFFHVKRGWLHRVDCIVGDSEYIHLNYLFVPRERMSDVCEVVTK